MDILAERRKGLSTNKLLNKCEVLIEEIENDIQSREVKRPNKYEELSDEIFIQGMDSDILCGKPKGSYKESKKLLKKCVILVEDIENDTRLGEAKMRHNTAKLLHKCEELIDEINNDINKGNPKIFQRQRKNKKRKKEIDIGRIKEEELNIISINARGIAKKKKSIEEILKNEDVDIAIISELSVKTVPKF